MARLETSPLCAERIAREVEHAGAGALVTFSGTVRDNHQGREVVAIEYHAYEPLALKEMSRIEGEVTVRWPPARVAIVHRVGHLSVGEASVVIAVSSPHRAAAFEALRFCIDRLKETVPIWKKELYTDGYAWIEGS